MGGFGVDPVRPTGQLPLPFSARPRYLAPDFRQSPSNADAVTWLGRTSDWPNRRLALWGEAGCGKTHLLHIWSARCGGVLWRGASLRGLPELPAVGLALDDADTIAEETALL